MERLIRVVSGKARAGDGAKGSRRVFARERKTRAHLLRRNCPVADPRPNEVRSSKFPDHR